MTPLRHRRTLGVAALAALAATGCDSSPAELDEPATLAVYLQDAPGDVDSVWVQIDGIVLHGGGSDVDVLDTPTPLINLTSLDDQAVALVEDVEIGIDSYSEIRVLIGGGVLQARSGDVYTMGDAEHPYGLEATGELHCPSCAQSGLKVKLARDVEIDEGENAVLLDFDVSQSFGHKAGNSGKWVMHPVIHAAAADPGEIEVGDFGGHIEGSIELGTDEQGAPVAIPVCGGSQRSLRDFVPLAVATTLVDTEGLALEFAGEVEAEEDGTASFRIDVTDFDLFLLTYVSDVELGNETLLWEATVSPGEVTLTAGDEEAEDLTFTVTGATCIQVAL